jgi:hypothetical protein
VSRPEPTNDESEPEPLPAELLQRHRQLQLELLREDSQLSE